MFPKLLNNYNKSFIKKNYNLFKKKTRKKTIKEL